MSEGEIKFIGTAAAIGLVGFGLYTFISQNSGAILIALVAIIALASGGFFLMTKTGPKSRY